MEKAGIAVLTDNEHGEKEFVTITVNNPPKCIEKLISCFSEDVTTKTTLEELFAIIKECNAEFGKRDTRIAELERKVKGMERTNKQTIDNLKKFQSDSQDRMFKMKEEVDKMQLMHVTTERQLMCLLVDYDINAKELDEMKDKYSKASKAMQESQAKLTQLEEEKGNTWREKYLCKICLDNGIDTALYCGHIFCSVCITGKNTCPLCRKSSLTKTKLFIC